MLRNISIAITLIVLLSTPISVFAEQDAGPPVVRGESFGSCKPNGAAITPPAGHCTSTQTVVNNCRCGGGAASCKVKGKYYCNFANGQKDSSSEENCNGNATGTCHWVP